MDVELLFTNILIDATVNIIINLAYNHPTFVSPNIPNNLLRELLEIRTKVSPFVTSDNRIYKQIDGLAMESPLKPTFSNFNINYLKESTFADKTKKPLIYAHYVDIIIIMFKIIRQSEKIKINFENNFILNFTIEKG